MLLFWFYLCWAVLLLGAEISFAHQNLAHYRREVRELPPGPAERESLGLRLALRVAQAFRDRSPAPAADDLSNATDSSVRTVNSLVEQLSDAGIIAEAGGEDRERVFQLGRPAEDVTVADVLAAIRGGRRAHERTPASRGQRPRAHDLEACDRAVDEVLGELDEAIAPVASERSLADLLANLPPGGRAPSDSAAGS